MASFREKEGNFCEISYHKGVGHRARCQLVASRARKKLPRFTNLLATQLINGSFPRGPKLRSGSMRWPSAHHPASPLKLIAFMRTVYAAVKLPNTSARLLQRRAVRKALSVFS